MTCRHCQAALANVFIDLGVQPPSNSFLKFEELDQPEPFFPLKAYVCTQCYLVQVPEHKSSTEIFTDEYVYFSSFSTSWVDHARRYAEMIIDRIGLSKDSFVVEIASNDGYLLQFFNKAEIPCLGVDPGASLAEAAKDKGVETQVAFFGRKTAREIAEERDKADLIIGNNVLAHVPDINDFVQGLNTLLAPEGVVTMEFPHLMRLVEGNQFDTIYHEHFSYLSLGTVQTIFQAFGLEIFDVEELPTHGGSIRIYACHKGASHKATGAVEALLKNEKGQGMQEMEYYTDFDASAQQVRDALITFLETQKNKGKSVAAYGAAAKGNTLLNYCNIGPELIDFCVDASPHKQGLYMPGSHIPVYAPEALKEHKPDYVLILPWNLKREIATQHAYISEWGGAFVVPIPMLVEMPNGLI